MRTDNSKLFLNRSRAMFLMVAVCVTVSIGPLLFRSMENADIWQIIFFRSISWITALTIILFYRYRLSFLKKIKDIGRWGFLAGCLLAGAQISFMQAMNYTTVANTVFVLSAIPFVTALTAYIFLGEKIKRSTLMMMVIAAIGIFIMVNEGIKSGNAFGNFMALITLLCFASFPVILRKNRHIDMIPTLIVPAILIGAIGLIIKGNDLVISQNDLMLCIIWGGIINGFAHSVFIAATRHLLAAEITLFMMLEFILGPLWVWGFVGEIPTYYTLLGGAVVMSAIGILTIIELFNKNSVDQNFNQINTENKEIVSEIKNKNVLISDKILSEKDMNNEESNIEKKELDDQTKNLIKSEIEKLLLKDIKKWTDKELPKIIEETAKEHLVIKNTK